jgi:hypothetical protein
MSMPVSGFETGDEVVLLAPQRQGQAPTDASRELARGVVTEVHAQHMEVRADVFPDGLDAAAAAARCNAPRPDPTVDPATLPVTPCMAREVRFLAIMSEATAMRLPGVLSGALAVVLTFLLGVELFGWLVGLFPQRHPRGREENEGQTSGRARDRRRGGLLHRGRRAVTPGAPERHHAGAGARRRRRARGRRAPDLSLLQGDAGQHPGRDHCGVVPGETARRRIVNYGF